MNSTKVRKELFIEALKKNLFIITAACEATGVSRKTYYQWRNDDPEFKRKCDEVEESQMDFVETQLLKRIKEGSDRAITFYLQTRAKKRGWGLGLDITTEGSKINEIKLTKVISQFNEKMNPDDFISNHGVREA